jgi:hypothetical protein
MCLGQQYFLIIVTLQNVKQIEKELEAIKVFVD